MQRRRTFWHRQAARIRSAVGVLCLAAGVAAAPILAPAAGDQTVISPQHARRPLEFETGKILRLDGALARRFADKADLSAYQESPLRFGSLCKRSGSIVLGTDDTILEDPDLLVFGGVTYSAVFRLEGDPFRSISIDVSAPAGVGFQIGDFETNLGSPPVSGQTLDGSGSLTFQLGARLTLDADEIAAGPDQEIAYMVTVAYE